MALDGGPAAPQRVRIRDRQIMALGLRRQGGSYRQIAAQMRSVEGISPKYSEALAHRDVMKALERLNAKCDEAAEAVKRLELERCDELMAAYYAKAKAGDIMAANVVFRCMDKIERLNGIDAQKVEHSGPAGGPIQFTEAVIELPPPEPDDGVGPHEPVAS